MKTAFDFYEEFGTPKELLCKRFNKNQIRLHSCFSGIYLCYQEASKSLITDLSMFNPKRELHVWKDPTISHYIVANNLKWYLYWSKKEPENINLLVRPFTFNTEKIELLKKIESSEFMIFLSSCLFDKRRLNPEKLLALINSYISSEVILDLNKKDALKAHSTMSLNQLAKLLKHTPAQLRHCNRNINNERQNVLNKLEQSSKIVHQLLNNPDFVLSPDQLWKRQ
jgi:hypothetical protein